MTLLTTVTPLYHQANYPDHCTLYTGVEIARWSQEQGPY